MQHLFIMSWTDHRHKNKHCNPDQKAYTILTQPKPTTDTPTHKFKSATPQFCCRTGCIIHVKQFKPKKASNTNGHLNEYLNNNRLCSETLPYRICLSSGSYTSSCPTNDPAQSTLPIHPPPSAPLININIFVFMLPPNPSTPGQTKSRCQIMHQAAPSSSAISKHRPHLDRRNWSDWCDEKTPQQ